MTEEELVSLPLTGLEEILKNCYLQRKDLQGQILEPDEMAAYIQWMIRTFADNPDYRMPTSSLDSFAGSRMAELGRRILRDPGDTAAIRQVAGSFAEQQENSHMVADHDISVGRMLRYMPSHWHRNDYFEIYFAFSGECPIHFRKETITLREGTVLIVAPGVEHASPCYRDDQVLLYYLIRSSTFDRVFWDRLPPENLMSGFFRRALGAKQPNAWIQFEAGPDPEIRRLLYQIYQEFLQKETYRAQMMNAVMTAFFILLLRRYAGTAKLPRREDFFWKHEFSAILSYIQTHYADARLPELASMFHYSERQVTRIVQRCTGMSYADLIRKLRMERAAVLLRRGTQSMEEISSELGYSSVSSFYRSFTKYYDCTPAEYRQPQEVPGKAP